MKHTKKALLALVLAVLFISCKETEPSLPDITVGFESRELGLEASETEAQVRIQLSRPPGQEVRLSIALLGAGVDYGTHFVTEPAAVNGMVQLPINAGSQTASLVLVRQPGILLLGDESLRLSLSSLPESFVPGANPEILISFGEIVARQSVIDPQVGGPLQPNIVFVNLRTARQQAVARNDWDLGFSMGDSFRATLNASSAMVAAVLDKTDMASVSAADTVGFASRYDLDAVFAAATGGPPPAWLGQARQWVDDPGGDLEKTAIPEIPASAAESRVVIINRGKNPDGSKRGWKKVRILREGNGYKVQYADIASPTFQEVIMGKDPSHHFRHLSFDNGRITVEPPKDRWDLAFTVFTNTTSFGPALVIPYVFNDIVLLNPGVESAQLLISETGSYESFTKAQAQAVALRKDRLNIGANWRSGGGPTGGPALREDRFYLIKDTAGNFYKLRFTALTQNGERGRPQIEYALLD